MGSNSPPPSRTFLKFALVLCLAADARTTVHCAAAPAAATPPVLLSPFEVTGQHDYGYRSGAAVTGTGTAGLIKDTPLNISIVSQELIRDQAGNQLVDVLRSASSAALHVKDE